MTDGIKTRIAPAEPRVLQEAAQVLAGGGLVAFPTETVYGVGADARSGTAVARLFAAKGRPSFNPLIAHVAEFADARALGTFNDDAYRLAAMFWPGPLTLVLPKAPGCPVAQLATAGLDTIAIRVPAHAVARDLIAAFDGPVVAPSANRSGHVSATTAAHVLADLGGCIDLVIDGGPTLVGVESTVVACLGDEAALLRPGAVARADLARVLARPLAAAPGASGDAARLAPGLLASHYAPKARLRLNATSVASTEALLAFGTPLKGARRTLNLSAQGNLIEASANLFAHLRALDADVGTIAVMPIPAVGLGEAINDRLVRAAAPRDKP